MIVCGSKIILEKIYFKLRHYRISEFYYYTIKTREIHVGLHARKAAVYR